MLLYLTHSRPEISYSICRLSQYMSKPIAIHMHATMQILKYVKNGPTLGMFFHDNLSAIHIAINMIFHELMKYIELDYHLVRDKLQENIIHLMPIYSRNQIFLFIHQTYTPWFIHQFSYQTWNVRYTFTGLILWII